MTKYVWMLVLGLGSVLSSAHASEDKLICRHDYYKDWNNPLLVARIGHGEVLKDIQMTFNKTWNNYFVNSTSGKGDLKAVRKSTISAPDGELGPQALSSRSPYNQGRHENMNNEYGFLLGNWSVDQAHRKPVGRSYMARLILPKDLGNKHLSTYKIRDGVKNNQANGVLVVDPAAFTGQYGQNYIWLVCKSE
ncbi:hypothetical protein K2X30_06885 [bacterium]|nr:hypothetical protein [bacterium]